MKNSLEYILNPEKTEQGTLVGGSHILPDAEFAFQKMLETKKVMDQKFGYSKMDGRQGYHFVLSFAPKDNVTPQKAMEITRKFIESYIPDYESVYVVHTDKKHLHSHIVFNSVSLSDEKKGKKYYYKNGDWEKFIQPITNRLCEEYGLSTIELKDYDKDKPKKKKSKTELIIEDVAECLKRVKSKTQFDAEMEKKGYTVKRKGARGQDLANVTVIPPRTGETEPKGHRLKGKQKELFEQLPETTAVKLFKRIEQKKNEGEGDRDKDGREEEFSETNAQEDSYEYWKDAGRKNAYEREKKDKEHSFVSQSKEKVYCKVKIKHTRVKIDLAGKYFLRDYCYRKNGRYYQEYVKFDLTRKKINYLHNNSIKTMEDLQNRKEALQKAAEKLESKKIMLWEERYPYKKLFDCYKRLEALRIPVQLYRDGDTTFSGEYEEMRKLIEKIHKSGMKLEELKVLYEGIRGQLSEIGKLEHELKKEMSLCEIIEKDSKKKQVKPLEQDQKKQTKKQIKKVR